MKVKKGNKWTLILKESLIIRKRESWREEGLIKKGDFY